MGGLEEDLRIGAVLGQRYRLVEVIGRGNSSMVLRGLDQPSGRTVAIKVLDPSWLRGSGTVEEFYAEHEVLRGLCGCSGIVRLLDTGVHDWTDGATRRTGEGSQLHFAVYELANYSAERLLVGATDLAIKLGIVSDVAGGLHCLHARGIVHRDVKAENVLVTDFGRPTASLGDFGRSGSPGDHEKFGFRYGDPRFPAPETIWLRDDMSADQEVLADRFLLGSLIFEMMTGLAFTAMVVRTPAWIASTAKLLDGARRLASFRRQLPYLEDRVGDVLLRLARASPRPIEPSMSVLLGTLLQPDPIRRLRPGECVTDAWETLWVSDQLSRMARVIHDVTERSSPTDRTPVKEQVPDTDLGPAHPGWSPRGAAEPRDDLWSESPGFLRSALSLAKANPHSAIAWARVAQAAQCAGRWEEAQQAVGYVLSSSDRGPTYDLTLVAAAAALERPGIV